MYSEMMRMGRAGVLARNSAFSWGAFGACWGLGRLPSGLGILSIQGALRL